MEGLRSLEESHLVVVYAKTMPFGGGPVGYEVLERLAAVEGGANEPVYGLILELEQARADRSRSESV